MLALPWRQYSSDLFSITDKVIRIREVTNDSHGLDGSTGLIAWDGAFVLAKFLEKRFAQARLEGTCVLELGAGVGVVSIAAAMLGAHFVFASDLAYALPNIQLNLEANGCNRAVAIELDWTKHYDYMALFRGQRPQMIVMADVVWIAELIPPLVAQLRMICDYAHKPHILLAHQTRSQRIDDLLFSTLHSHRFTIRSPSLSEYAEQFQGVPVYEIESL